MADQAKNYDQSTPRELLPQFYKQYNLTRDGGQSLPYVRIEFFKNFALYIPNFEVRKKAVFKHDIHHIVTEYPSTFKGETEISAWELASGVRKYWIAFVLDIQAVTIGILFNPRNVFRAYARGRRTQNLYTDKWPDDVIMDMSVGVIKEKLKLDVIPKKTKGTFIDLLFFLVLLSIGFIYSLFSILLLPFVILYSLWVMATIKKTPLQRGLNSN